jgi:hypothetical protein
MVPLLDIVYGIVQGLKVLPLTSRFKSALLCSALPLTFQPEPSDSNM